jgi:integrase
MAAMWCPVSLTRVAKDLLRRNVASFAEAPQPKGPEMLILNREEIRTFLGTTRGDRLEAIYVLALATGMRRSELLGLKWRDLDLEEDILLVRRGLTISPDGGVEIDARSASPLSGGSKFRRRWLRS